MRTSTVASPSAVVTVLSQVCPSPTSSYTVSSACRIYSTTLPEVTMPKLADSPELPTCGPDGSCHRLYHAKTHHAKKS